MSRATSLLHCLLVLGTACAPARADEPLTLEPREGVLLLRNGQVLQGKITPAGDLFYVSLPHIENCIKASDVVLHGLELIDVYEYKRARIGVGQTAEHLELAQWCIQNDLFDAAAEEIGAARQSDPKSVRIPRVEQQLKLARQKPIHPSRASAADLGPTKEDLDRLVRNMPSGSVQHFTSTIQPLLMNSCFGGGCHGPHCKNSLRLQRVPLTSAATRSMTQRNLHSVWQNIDRNDPAASKLLRAAAEPHGNAKTPIFTDREAAQYRQLVAWVYEVAQGRKPTQPRHVSREASPLLQTTPKPLAPKPAGPSQPAVRPAMLLDDEAPPHMGSAIPKRDDSEPARLDTPSDVDYVPLDPFDPEVFNRKYLPAESR